MANRWNVQFPLTFEKKVVSIYAKVAFGSTGAPTISAVNSKGVVSVTRNSAGTYTFVFGTQVGMLDTYVKFLNARVIFDTSATVAAPAAPGMYVATNSVPTYGTSSIKIVTTSSGSVATDPASGEIGYFKFELGDSTAP